MTKATKAGVVHVILSTHPPPTQIYVYRAPLCIFKKGCDIFIIIHAKPRAKQSCVTEISASHVSFQIAAPAQEGEANGENDIYIYELWLALLV